jgi:hypothetical protein
LSRSVALLLTPEVSKEGSYAIFKDKKDCQETSNFSTFGFLTLTSFLTGLKNTRFTGEALL